MPVGAGERDKAENIAVCRTEIALTLEELLSAVAKGLKFGGRAALVHRADRLCDVICLMRKFGIEPKRLRPVAAKGKSPYLILVEGVKGGKRGLAFQETLYN